MLASLLLALAASGGGEWNPADWSQEVTECDRLIAHPDDPDHLAPGVSQKKADLPRAIDACRAAVEADPDNPRLNYQLARALGYSGRGVEAGPYRAKAVEGGYPQALFVVGYITLFGMNEQPQDTCEGGRLIYRSARAGRFAGLVGFPYYWSEGMFEGCDFEVSEEELSGFLDAAGKQAAGDYYKELLVSALRR